MRRKDVQQQYNLVKSSFPNTGQVAASLGSPDAQETWTEGGQRDTLPLQDEVGCVVQGVVVGLFLHTSALFCYRVSILGLRSASEHFQIPVPSPFSSAAIQLVLDGVGRVQDGEDDDVL